MRPFERMIEGVGFYYDSRQGGLSTLPSFDECRGMIEELAYHKWQASGGDQMHNWLDAEHELFVGLDGDGYDVYVCDLAARENQGFFRHWDQKRITPHGIENL